MTLIALDPGLTTGVAIHRTRIKCPECHGVFGELRFAQHAECETLGRCDSNGFLPDQYITLVVHKNTEVRELIEYHRPTVTIFEDFNSGGLIDKNGQATIRLIGYIEAVTQVLNIPTCLQFPRERYPMIDPARQLIKAMNKKYLIHEVDALAHLLLYEDRVRRGVLDKITERRRTNKVTKA